MKYHIHFTYEGRYGRSFSDVYTNTKEEALEKIEAHKNDKTEPKLKKWRLYELTEEGEA